MELLYAYEFVNGAAELVHGTEKGSGADNSRETGLPLQTAAIQATQEEPRFGDRLLTPFLAVSEVVATDMDEINGIHGEPAMNVEDQLRAESGDLSTAVRESFVLDLFRRGLLNRQELSQNLSLDRFETYALLKRHHLFEDSLTHEEADTDFASARALLGITDR